MRIAIDALGIHYYGGGRTATLKLLEALFAIDHDNEYLVFLTRHEPTLETAAGHVTQYIAPTTNRFALRLWAQASLPFLTRQYDLIHFIKNLGVFFIPTRQVVTIYDLTTLIYPELFPKPDVWYWRTLQSLTLRNANRIIAISENTSKDLQHFYHLPSQKISVIYPAHGDHFSLPSPAAIKNVRSKYNLPENFILHVGRIDRKKNLQLLVSAFDILRKSGKFSGELVFVGEEYLKIRDPLLFDLIAELDLKDVVRFTGPVPDEDLPPIYGAALCSAFCSLHEGFGIVALEAMASGSPLVVTPAGAVVEVVRDAALVLTEETPQCLADNLTQLLNDTQLREDLRRRGLQRAAEFSWDQAARQTLEVYLQTVKHSAGSS